MSRPRTARARLSGFTIIELLVVIVIIGILAAAGQSKYQSIVESSRQRTCISNLTMIDHAVSVWCAQNKLPNDTVLSSCNFDTFGKCVGVIWPPNHYPNDVATPFTGNEIGLMIADRKVWVCPKFMQRQNYTALSDVPVSFDNTRLHGFSQYGSYTFTGGCYGLIYRPPNSWVSDDMNGNFYLIPNDTLNGVQLPLCLDSGLYFMIGGSEICPKDMGAKLRHAKY
jgi:prepilin-type N-terminal cleavage/methylation domain-containing protein